MKYYVRYEGSMINRIQLNIIRKSEEDDIEFIYVKILDIWLSYIEMIYLINEADKLVCLFDNYVCY
jgi:hypothetical protein